MTFNKIGQCKAVLTRVGSAATRSHNNQLPVSIHCLRPFSTSACSQEESPDQPNNNYRKHRRHSSNHGGGKRFGGGSSAKPEGKPRKYMSRWQRERLEEEMREKVDQMSNSLYSDYDPQGKTTASDPLTSPSSSSAAGKVQMDDVMALKPKKKAVTPEEFDKVKEQISRAFKIDQLKQILHSQNIPATGKKAHLVTQVAMLMDLEILEPQKPKPVMEDPLPWNDQEVSSEVCRSSRQELFFILGSEPGTLQKLEQEKSVRISINIMDETYTIRGSSEEAILDAKASIKELVNVKEQDWDISVYPLEPEMTNARSLEEIARLSGTYVTLKDDKTLSIAGRSTRDIEEAKQLFDLKAHKPIIPETNELFTLGRDDFAQYGMFPIYDPLLLGPEASKQAFFRINENGQSSPISTLKLNSILYPVQSSGAHAKTLSDLRSHFETSIQEELKGSRRFELSARFGHLLFSNPSDNILKVPIGEAFTVERLESWLEESEAPRFFDSFPFYKVVNQLRRIGDKKARRTIEVDYCNSPRYLLSNKDDASKVPLTPIHIAYEIDVKTGRVVLKEGKQLVSRLNANLMALTRPADIQIRGDIIQPILSSQQELIRLASESSLIADDRLVSPPFFSFGSVAAQQQDQLPAASQVGLSNMPTHTLQSVRLRVTREFDFDGFTLVASDVQDQLRPIRRQELVLLPKKITSSSSSSIGATEPTQMDKMTEQDPAAQTSNSKASGEVSAAAVQQSAPLENWSELMTRVLDLSSQL